MAAFGWSAGDIAQAINIVYKVGAALRDTGGASSDYQETIQFLEGLAATLEKLQKFDEGVWSPEDFATIKSQVDLVRTPISDFTRNIRQKYEHSLGSKSATGLKGAFLGGPKKARWALFATKEAKALREKVVIPLFNIQLSHGMQIL
jgi:hypothetical protein